MRLHSLTVTAVGPFAGTEHVDFDTLAADGLFLLTGPTGSGKTTVLDAITYALYGSLPGVREGHSAKIKSDHVAAEVCPEVVLECTLGGQRVRITRSPAYQRPTKRGTGLTEQRAAVFLEIQQDGSWFGVEGGRREAVVQDWLRERLGLSLTQFVQVVLLPQGQFARFLTSSDGDREAVLRTLFRADRFTAVEEWLAERQRSSAEHAAATRDQLDRLKDRVQVVAGLDDDDVPEIPSEEWFDEIVTTLRERVQVQRTAAAATGIQVTNRTSELARARRVAELQIARSTAQRNLEEILAQATLRDRQRARITAAHRAAGVARLVELMDAARVRQQLIDDQRAAAWRLVQKLARQVDVDLTDPRTAQEQLISRRASLDAALVVEAGLAALQREVDETEARAAETHDRLTRLRGHLSDLPARLAEAQTELGLLTGRAAQLASARADRERLQAAHAAACQVVDLEPLLAAADDGLRTAIDESQRTREHYLDLQEQRIAAMAGELAGALVPGEPCSVCGSESHPRPAVAGADTPTKEVIAAARRAAERAESTRQTAAADRAGLAEQLAALRSAAGGRDPATVAEALAGAVSAYADATAAEQDLEELRDRIAALQALHAEAAEHVDSAAAAESEAGAAHRDVSIRLQHARDEVTAAVADHPTVAAHHAVVCRAITALDDALARDGDAKEAARAAVEHKTAAEQTAADHGFFDLAQAREAILGPEELDRLQAAVDEHDAALARAEAAVANPDFDDLPAGVPDVPARQTELDVAVAADRAAAAALARSTEALDHLGLLQSRVLGEIAELAARELQAARVRDLALVVRGQGSNEKRMSLTSYYLSARLEQVTEIASDHLLRMTAGRYTLLHTDQRATRRGHGGLGLLVLDSHTGVTRPPHTLSGGETFAASLALALALAEVVTSEAGGIAVDSLFIDEGFGALDPQYLDDAMAVIDQLRTAGRTIGLVSHVDELRARIPAQLAIERTETGSRIVGSGSGWPVSDSARMSGAREVG